MEPFNREDYLTTYEAADLCGVHHGTITKACREGRIKGAVKPFSAWLIPKRGVEMLFRPEPKAEDE